MSKNIKTKPAQFDPVAAARYIRDHGWKKEFEGTDHYDEEQVVTLIYRRGPMCIVARGVNATDAFKQVVTQAREVELLLLKRYDAGYSAASVDMRDAITDLGNKQHAYMEKQRLDVSSSLDGA